VGIRGTADLPSLAAVFETSKRIVIEEIMEQYERDARADCRSVLDFAARKSEAPSDADVRLSCFHDHTSLHITK